MTAKALDYAEITLGVHAVHQTAVEARDRLEACLAESVAVRDRKRVAEHALADREQDLLQQAWIDNPDMSQARMDKHIKTLYFSDATWRELRVSLAEAASTLDGLEADRSVVEADIRIAVSRMQELGGYLSYLAAVKTAAAST